MKYLVTNTVENPSGVLEHENSKKLFKILN